MHFIFLQKTIQNLVKIELVFICLHKNTKSGENITVFDIST